MDDDGDGFNVPIPGVDVPDHDTVLDQTSNVLLGIPHWGWTVIAAIILGLILKAIFNKINFKIAAGVLVVLFLAAYFGVIGKG